jgi:prepilin-type N-terminal cleavage/methylation domain-containing protein/prepilin-type processing-associated H-X9-DG protein
VERRRSAFTLIELLAVMAILTLLMGILIPSLTAARRQAKANVCLSKMKGISTAFTIYLNENKDHFPPMRLKKLYPTATEEYVNEYRAKSPRWQWFLEMESGPVIDPKPFARLNRPWGDVEPGMGKKTMTMTNDVFTCPALDDEEYAKNIRNGAYGYNYQYLGNARQQSDPKRWDNFSVPLHRIKAPSMTVLLADSRGAGNPHGLHSYTLDPPRLAIEQNAKQFGPDADMVRAGQDPAVYQFSPVEMRHRGLGNVAFVDGHGEAMTLLQLGYELLGDNPDEKKKKDTAVPVLDPTVSTVKATNRLWTGSGQDSFADARTPPRSPP